MRNGFYLLVLIYGAQRFAWEFLKPYGAVLGPFNLFHFICAGLVIYSAVMMQQRGGQDMTRADFWCRVAGLAADRSAVAVTAASILFCGNWSASSS